MGIRCLTGLTVWSTGWPWTTDLEATSRCGARRPIKGLALPVKFQDHKVLPCGGVGLPKGLNRSAFALTISHNSDLIYSPVARPPKRRDGMLGPHGAASELLT